MARIRSFIVFFLPLCPLQANINNHLPLISLEKNLYYQEKSLKKILKKIQEFETSLENKNNSMISLLKKKDSTISSIDKISKDLKEEEEKLREIKSTVKKEYFKIILSSLEKKQDVSNLLHEKLLRMQIKKRLKEFEKKEVKIFSIKEKIQVLREKFNRHKGIEGEIQDLLNDLEKKKRRFISEYKETKNKKNKMYFRYQKIKKNFLLNERVKRDHRIKEKKSFSLPLENYTNVFFKKKGITFEFEKGSPLFSSNKGKVVHVGKLSKYGSVMIIEHNDHLRSVLLGDFTPKKLIGKIVSKGAIVGYTLSSNKRYENYGKIYFEIRKKNKVQNTSLYMNEKQLVLHREKSSH